MASRGPPRREPIDVTAVERRAIVLGAITSTPIDGTGAGLSPRR